MSILCLVAAYEGTNLDVSTGLMILSAGLKYRSLFYQYRKYPKHS